ncbi:TPA: hypothetical protein G8577_004794 [Salmonella enterica]|uniref:Uncharacterized protein n=1 Tax=Salmonella enterica TaxID=28901 RepID=A0A764Z2D2_SALER|nr:hypothetical protein [Salmonella enterica]
MAYEILMAEAPKGTKPEDYDVYAFNSLDELKNFRKSFPEKMRFSYSYFLSGGQKNGSLIEVASACHYKQFIKLIKEKSIQI